MSDYTIYHNPRCGKSRAALKILSEHRINPEIIEYLKTPPNKAEIRGILRKLRLPIRAIIREGEADYREQQLSDPARTEDELLDAIVEHPILLQRPIVVSGDRALIARPPEKVEELLR